MTKALLLTLFVSFFFLVGLFLSKLFKKKDKLILITTALSFIIMVYLMVFDLLLEIIEIGKSLEAKNTIFLLLFGILGFISLKIVDIFIPEHHHDHQEEQDDIKEHNSHLFHIGFLTAISLIIHNILEGISIYITALGDFKLGCIMALTVSCHNLPLGIEIGIGLEARKDKKIEKIGLFLLLFFSSFIGAFLLFLLQKDLSLLTEGILLSLTFGMIFYISIFELLPELQASKKTKEIKIGIVLGFLLILILFLL